VAGTKQDHKTDWQERNLQARRDGLHPVAYEWVAMGGNMAFITAGSLTIKLSPPHEAPIITVSRSKTSAPQDFPARRRLAILPGALADFLKAFDMTHNLQFTTRGEHLPGAISIELTRIFGKGKPAHFLSRSLATSLRPPGSVSRPGWARLFLLLLTLALPALCRAQEPPYFVTYSDYMEEPGNLEITLKSSNGTPKYGNPFLGETLELEYGAKGWWTTEVYLAGQRTAHDSTVFTGWRWENRFRPLPREHFINPVFYIEYENVSQADRSLLEITGHDSVSDLLLSNSQGRSDTERSLETKLILSSQARGWDISVNFIAEKALNESEPWEFGYAVGISRPLASAAHSKACVFCRENFSAGAELYGGLGTLEGFSLKATSQYLAPTVEFNIPHGPSIGFSPNFGLNANSMEVLYRLSVSYELQQLFHRGRTK